MPGLDPGIHVDRRAKPGGDGSEEAIIERNFV